MRSIISRVIFLIIFLLILSGIILIARGYRFNPSKKTITPTGILVVSSYPDGAKIYLNGQFYGATNSNINLLPGNYLLEVKKNGYTTWKKEITIKGEVVVKADALLYLQNPTLSPITSLGVIKAVYSERTGKSVIFSQNDNLEKDGIYLLETNRRPLSLFDPLKLLLLKNDYFPENNLEEFNPIISPDGKQIMLSSDNLSYLISSEEKTKDVFDITNSKEIILEAWEKEIEKSHKKILETFKEPFPKIASDSFRIISFSPDETKILYQAKQDVSIPIILKPPLIGTNQTKEERNIKKDNLYVYDKKEDKNYLIENCSLKIENCLFWYPDSQHLVIKEEKQISMIDYDGTNKQTVYSGPFEKDFLAVTSDGKILILANLNPQNNKLPDVYAVGIK